MKKPLIASLRGGTTLLDAAITHAPANPAKTVSIVVPYAPGGAPLADVMGARVCAMFIGSPPAMPLLQSGERNAMAVTLSWRMVALPNVPVKRARSCRTPARGPTEGRCRQVRATGT